MKENSDLHILYILTKLELGGAQKVCLSLFKGIRQHGGSTSLISGSEGTLISEVKTDDPVYLMQDFKREVGFSLVLNEMRAFFKMIARIRRLKKRYPKLIVHTHSTKAGVMGRWAAFFARVKIRVHTVHGFGFHAFQNKFIWFIHYFFELLTSFVTTKYVCVSKLDRAIGTRLFPFFSRKSTLIRAAVDQQKFYIPARKTVMGDRSDQMFIFGTTSCFKPQKNLIDLFKAFKYVHDSVSQEQKKNIELHVAGDGILRPVLEKWVCEQNLQNSIRFLGWQSDMVPLLHGWDVFVMSSLWEGLPCAIVEARLSKLPVIAYNVGGISEVVRDSDNGFLIKPKDWEALGRKMMVVFSDSALYTRLVEYKDDLGDFYDEVMIKNHWDLYSTFF
jgi:glycosyltransferase involved in cell wall biosynthesis